jgi:hypothetical protein
VAIGQLPWHPTRTADHFIKLLVKLYLFLLLLRNE